MTAWRRPGVRAGATLALLLLLVLAVLACEASGWPFLRRPLQDALARATGVPVLLEGRFHTRLLWRPRLQVEHLRLGAGADVPVPHLLDARTVDLAWRWRDLWRWRQGEPLRVQSLQAGALDAHLVRLADGRASWQLGRDRARVPNESRRPADELPRLGRLQLQQALIVWNDAPLNTQLRIELAGGEGSAATPPPDTAAPGQFTAAAPAGAQGYRGTVSGRYRALPLDLQLRSSGAMPFIHDTVSAAPGGGRAEPLALRVEGRAGAAQVFFDGHAAALMGDRELAGQIRVRGPSLAPVGAPLGITLPQTGPFDLQGHLAHDAGVWQLRADSMVIGRSRLNGDFRHDTRVRPPRLSGQLGGTRLALADLGPAVGAGAGAGAGAAKPGRAVSARGASSANAPATAPGRVLPQRRFDLPSLQGMEADVKVALDELDLGSDALAPLREVRTQIHLQGGVLQLRALQAVAAGGRFAGSTQLDARAEPARWALDLRFDGIDVAGWLRGLRTAEGRSTAPRDTQTAALQRQRQQQLQQGRQGQALDEGRLQGEGAQQAAKAAVAKPVQSYLSGTLTGHAQLAGAGRSVAEILATLDGRAQLMLRQGTLSHLATEALGLDVAEALGVMIRGDRPLPLRCARLDLVAKDGLLQTRRALLDNADTTIRLGGRIDLRQESLALQMQARPKDVSPLSLRTPVIVGGTLAAPQVGVDKGKLAAKVLGALALGAAVGPLAALLPLVDPGEDEGDPCAANGANGANSANAANNARSGNANTSGTAKAPAPAVQPARPAAPRPGG